MQVEVGVEVNVDIEVEVCVEEPVATTATICKCPTHEKSVKKLEKKEEKQKS